MAKAAKSTYVCQSCGAVSPRWAGKCPGCGDWNTMVEETAAPSVPGTGLARATKGRPAKLETLQGKDTETARTATGLAELDRVTGGGLVPASVLLIGGEPGIG
ncbi:MAG: DNA repair protein RadA, partial [Hyphomicrobiaceae bacterium]|nr:DNA repair protein RadA [Hyphomicrobiaceae bacterium]